MLSTFVAVAAACSDAETWPAASSGGVSNLSGASGAPDDAGGSGAQTAGGAKSSGGAFSSGAATNAGGGPSAAGTTGAGGDSSEGGESSEGGTTTGGSNSAGGALNGVGSGSGEGGSETGGATTGGEAGGDGPPVTGRSPGCGTALERPEPRAQQRLNVNGATRYYLLDVPETSDNQTPLALVFALHGYDMNNVAVIDHFDFTSRSNGRAITVLPQGEGPPPGDEPHWSDGVLKSHWNADENNYAFIRELWTDLQARFCVDPARIFITGFSMGGFFTNSLACDHPELFRGYAPIAGGGPGSCDNADAKPAVMISHGNADEVVSPGEGEGSRNFWRQNNGCGDSTAPSFMGCQSYNRCPDASPVIHCVGDWDHTITETQSANIWSFFESLR